MPTQGAQAISKPKAAALKAKRSTPGSMGGQVVGFGKKKKKKASVPVRAPGSASKVAPQRTAAETLLRRRTRNAIRDYF